MNPYKSDIANFISNYTTDHKGRTCKDILSLNTFWLEADHDFIQWLFPIDTQTKFNKHAPMVDDVAIEEFSGDNALKMRHRNVLDRMLQFYGLMRLNSSLAPAERITPATQTWLREKDHNHLRITRILRSLYLLGQQDLARGLSSEFIRIASNNGFVTQQTFNFWTNAVRDQFVGHQRTVHLQVVNS